MGKEPAVIQQEIAATRERLGDTAGALADKANVPARVSRTLDAFGEGMAGRSPKDMLSTDELRRATRGVAGFARENPFGFAIGAMAAGFIVGMLLPATEIEDEKSVRCPTPSRPRYARRATRPSSTPRASGRAHSPGRSAGAHRRGRTAGGRELPRARRGRARRPRRIVGPNTATPSGPAAMTHADLNPGVGASILGGRGVPACARRRKVALDPSGRCWQDCRS